MDEEERKLQIKIAQLNAHLQVNLGWTFGLFASTIAFWVFGYQMYSSNLSAGIVVQLVAVVLLAFTFGWVARVNNCLNELDALK